MKPRRKQEIQLIFKNVGFDLNNELFETTWNAAASLNPYGEGKYEYFLLADGKFLRMSLIL